MKLCSLSPPLSSIFRCPLGLNPPHSLQTVTWNSNPKPWPYSSPDVFFLCLKLCLRTETSEFPSEISTSSSLSILLQWETSAGRAHVCLPLLATIFDFPHSLPVICESRERTVRISQQCGQWPQASVQITTTHPGTSALWCQGRGLIQDKAPSGLGTTHRPHQENIHQPEAMAHKAPWSLLSIRTTWWHV